MADQEKKPRVVVQVTEFAADEVLEFDEQGNVTTRPRTKAQFPCERAGCDRPARGGDFYCSPACRDVAEGLCTVDEIELRPCRRPGCEKRITRFRAYCSKRCRALHELEQSPHVWHKSGVIERAGGRCELCGVTCTATGETSGSPTDAEVDHCWPTAAGGVDELRNAQLLCRRCHDAKAAFDLAAIAAYRAALFAGNVASMMPAELLQRDGARIGVCSRCGRRFFQNHGNETLCQTCA